MLIRAPSQDFLPRTSTLTAKLFDLLDPLILIKMSTVDSFRLSLRREKVSEL